MLTCLESTKKKCFSSKPVLVWHFLLCFERKERRFKPLFEHEVVRLRVIVYKPTVVLWNNELVLCYLSCKLVLLVTSPFQKIADADPWTTYRIPYTDFLQNILTRFHYRTRLLFRQTLWKLSIIQLSFHQCIYSSPFFAFDISTCNTWENLDGRDSEDSAEGS